MRTSRALRLSLTNALTLLFCAHCVHAALRGVDDWRFVHVQAHSRGRVTHQIPGKVSANKIHGRTLQSC